MRLKVVVAIILIMKAVGGFAQIENMTIIKGQFKGRVPKEISLKMVSNGVSVVHSTIKVSKDGVFGFMFIPEYSGFYTVGNYSRVYVEPGKNINLTISDTCYTVDGNDPENIMLEKWANVLWSIKKCNYPKTNYTFHDLFPLLPKIEKEKDAILSANKTGNKKFDKLFTTLVEAEFEYEVYHFLYMPRTAHPTPADYPEIYQRISNAKRFQDISALDLDFGLQYLFVYLQFQVSNNKSTPTRSPEDICIEKVSNDTIKGLYFANNVLNRAKAYDEKYIALLDKYRKFLVTDEQKKMVADFIFTINKSGSGEPGFNFEGTTTDGKKISFSDFKGKVILVDDWATWCGPCRAEIPALKKLEEELKVKDLVVIGYSIDESKNTEKWKQLVQKEDLKGIQLIAPAAFKSPLCTNYNITAIPRFMVFDKKGNVVTIDSPRPSKPELKELLLKYL